MSSKTMHEFSLCQNIIDIAANNLKPKQHIQSITLKIGSLAQVDIESLKFWFPVAAKNSVCANATLTIHIEPAVAHCQQCQADYQPQTLYDACPNCQSCGNPISSGQELLVQSIEIS